MNKGEVITLIIAAKEAIDDIERDCLGSDTGQPSITSTTSHQPSQGLATISMSTTQRKES